MSLAIRSIVSRVAHSAALKKKLTSRQIRYNSGARPLRVRPLYIAIGASLIVSLAAGSILLLDQRVDASAAAFKIGAFDAVTLSSPPIHEQITGEAIRTVTPNALAGFSIRVSRGNENTDLTHQMHAWYHFDSIRAGDKAALDAAFETVHRNLAEAKEEAKMAGPNFLKPVVSTSLFRDIAEAVDGEGGGGCRRRHVAASQLRAVGVLPAVSQDIHFDVEAQHAMRRQIRARR